MYNGWKNYETWNVALWINNDRLLYSIAKEVKDYSVFVHDLKLFKMVLTSDMMLMTPDGVRWDHPELDTKALNEMIKDL